MGTSNDTDSGTRAAATEVLVRLDRSAGGPLRAQLEQQLRALIRSGRLPAGATLPSSRLFAADLGVSRRLVVAAYQQLAAEGYLTSQQRSVTRVATVSPARPVPAPNQPSPPRYDLRPGPPALAEFPRAAWRKAFTAALSTAPDTALGYPDPQGSIVLRHAVATYLRRVRAVSADPDRIVICAGFTQALALLTHVLDPAFIALENPGAVGRDRTIAAAGGQHLALPVDQSGLRTDLLTDPAITAVMVTPAHQFPLGVTLAPDRRTALLRWAQDGGLVIEDDYDAEFRYDRAPVGALQGLAPEHVAYLGTVSKTLAPALRLGWMVLPVPLVGPVTQAKADHDAGSPTLDQLALAHLLDTGGYDRHLRRVRRLYRQRRDHLLAALQRHMPITTISGTAAGLHLVIQPPPHPDLASMIADAARNDVAITGLDRYLLPDTAHDPGNRLVISYANIATTAIDTAIARLSRLAPETVS
ncbi:MAG: GntR family transcriptional regulator [Pseudonocardiales bacterium]|nr:MAG: GntR family transcriptional regulator [Pseudonocardiales bacterium]